MTDLAEVETLTWPNGEVVDVESIEGYTEDARVIAHPLDDAVIRTPDWVIGQLVEVSRWAARMPKVTAMAEALKRERKRELDEARAQAVLDVAGHPSREHSARVTLAVVEERRAYDRATVAAEEARRVGNLLADYTGRLQSIGKQVELTYRAEMGRS
ncbi:hypothetical protein CSIV_05115 [Microbacterium sp. CSI-V]|uniref:hypothetical protein n=1 Tax=Microbacterium sp. CSI-V TaxID=1933777 RepID=UPI00097C6EA0|nr:hypothetical protein [Microbacterium sp. CSI-V]ONI65660.1 hypothetical protein CSIV_05115 [Microbacterium sp. CSI-V]